MKNARDLGRNCLPRVFVAVVTVLGVCLATAHPAQVGDHVGPGPAIECVAKSSNPWMLLEPGRPLLAVPGERAAVKSLAGATPRTLAEADLDRNAVPDVLIGYGTAEGGLVVAYLGDPGAYPARGAELPFMPTVQVAVLPMAPDWLAAGDFDGDGWQDVIAAANGRRQLALLRGLGGGELAEAEMVALPGAVTALAVGDVNRRDGLEDLAVAVVHGAHSELLVFEGPEGALRGDPEVFALPAPASDVEIAKLASGIERDIAVASGNKLVVIHGRDRKLSWAARYWEQVAAATVDHIAFESAVTAVAVGRFTRRHGAQVVALSDDGAAQLVSWQEDGFWHREAVSLTPGEVGQDRRLLEAGRVSSLPGDDLLLASSPNQLRLMNLPDAARGSATADPPEPQRVSANIDARSPVVAVLPIRLNLDALHDLVVLVEGGTEPLIMTTRSRTTYTVNQTTDVLDNTCDSHCTLRDAIYEADNHPGLDTIAFDVGSTAIVTTETLAINDSVFIDGWQCPLLCFPTEIDGPDDVGSAVLVANTSASSTTFKSLIIHGASLRDGIDIRGDDSYVENCYLGVTFSGTSALDSGVYVHMGGSNNTIGGAPTLQNLISGNNGTGIKVFDANVSGTVITGNLIGTNLTGDGPEGNAGHGIHIDLAASDTTIGETAAPNVISANSTGIRMGDYPLANQANSNLVQNNLIGLDDDGNMAMSNSSAGIWLRRGSGNTFGGTVTSLGNTISANLGHGIHIDTQSTGSQVQANIIGLTEDGMNARGNGLDGVHIESSSVNTIGGSVSDAGNVISANGDDGVEIYQGSGNSPNDNSLQYNTIGSQAAAALCRGNSGDGVVVVGAANHVGENPGQGNMIVCSGGDGVVVTDEGTTGTSIVRNHIGRSSGGASQMPNAGNGVTIKAKATNTQVGATGTHRNTIAYNDGAGIVVAGRAVAGETFGHTLAQNSIFANGGLEIDLAPTSSGDGVTLNDFRDLDEGPNDYLNFPVILGYNGVSNELTVTLESAPNQTYTIDVLLTYFCEPSGYGGGEGYVASGVLITDGTGSGTAVIDVGYQEPEKHLVALATDSQGSTSEYSLCYRITGLSYIFSDGFETGDTLRWSATVP